MRKFVLVAAMALGWFSSDGAQAQELPQLDAELPIVCVETDDGRMLRIQCDEKTKVCLSAEARLGTVEGAPDVVPRELTPCATSRPGTYERLSQSGYQFVSARHEAPYGYRRDELGRLFQTHFDLRRRYFVGVGWGATSDLEGDVALLGGSVDFQVGGIYEHFSEETLNRHRFRFLEAKLELTPVRTEGLVLGYDLGRQAIRPTLWITTFFGEPRRYDLNMHIGPGLQFLRWWGTEDAGRALALLDLAQGHLGWEIVQGTMLEDYLSLRLGAGMGVLIAGMEGDFYLYPEAAFDAGWVAGDRGLWEFRTSGRMRFATLPSTNETFYEATVALSMERIFIAVTDQPVSLYLEPELSYRDLAPADARRVEARVLAGIRVSLFTPPRRPDDQCPTEGEDYDGYRDEDGCPDFDNDGDGVPDLQDSCPMEPEDVDGDSDEDGCPEY